MSNVHSFDIKVWDPAPSPGPDGLPGIAKFDDDGINGVDDPGELGAPGTDDFAPLTAIQITVRYNDEISDMVRDVTTVVSLAYSP